MWHLLQIMITQRPCSRSINDNMLGLKNSRRVMLLHDYKITKIRRSLCHPEWIAVTVEVSDDISEVFPYLNAILKNAVYTPRVPSLNFKMETGFASLAPQEINVGQVLCEEDAIKILDYLKKLINDTWERRTSITPVYERKGELKAKDIVHFLPKTNCRDCGLPTCFAFAMAMTRGQKRLTDCSALSKPEFAQDKEALVRLFQSVASQE
jgi:ArsR family metal-binding transcriptional regulator